MCNLACDVNVVSLKEISLQVSPQCLLCVSWKPPPKDLAKVFAFS